MSLPSAAIVGAGLAGLVCARILQSNDIDVSVYEAESSPTSRPQGGRLDIHAATGQAALAAAGLLEEFNRLASVDAQATKVVSAAGDVLYAGVPGGDGWNPEIERGVLRELLLGALKPGTVVWGAKVARVSAESGPGAVVELVDGSSVRHDLVVGADGAWSRVRPLLTDKKPRYAGVCLVESRIEDLATTDPASHAWVSPGSLFAVGRQNVLFVHGGKHGWAAAGFYAPEAWHEGVDWSDERAANEHVLEQLGGWDVKLKAFIGNSTSALVPRPLYMLPIFHRWQHRAGVTLIGDAAHLMSSFAGWGANLALLDGALLAEAIVGGGEAWQGAVREFERAMFARSWKPALLSVLSMAMYFGPRGAARVAYTFNTVQAGLSARVVRLFHLGTSALYLSGFALKRRALLKYALYRHEKHGAPVPEILPA